jgi:hypothetical protein
MDEEAEPLARLEELRQKIQAGIDDFERGDFAELDMAAIKAEARQEREARQAKTNGGKDAG